MNHIIVKKNAVYNSLMITSQAAAHGFDANVFHSSS
jgi:peroxiredoxin family protein